MAQLQEYKTLQEKVPFFQQGDIRIAINIDKLFEKLDELVKDNCYIYRGCNEAKYKIYNSAQRIYITSELFRQAQPNEVQNHYDDFINNLILESKNWNNFTVKHLLKAAKIDEGNSLAYLSLMQHYGIPTPFLDFTSDPYIGLFFAVDNISYSPSDNEINNYFSIYYTNTNAEVFKSWVYTFDKLCIESNNGNIPYEKVSECLMSLLLPENAAYKILNNTNIINQKGLFFYNNDPVKPLEVKYLEYYETLRDNLGREIFNKIPILNIIGGCYNIHKSLIPYILKKLKEKGITREYLFSDMYKMKHEVMNNSIINSIQRIKQ